MNRQFSLKAASIAACALCALVASSAAHATYRFTYDSGPVPWNFAERNGAELIDVGQDEQPRFSLSFDAPDSWLSVTERTEFVMPSPTVYLWNQTVQYTVAPSVDNIMAMSGDGSIFGWTFGFQFTPVFAPGTDPLTIATNKSYGVHSTSSMGSSCPCDNVTVTMNDIEWINGQPTPSGSILINYRGVNEWGPGWTISPISPAPEPGGMAMMLGGIGMIGWLARRKRGSDKSKEHCADSIELRAA